MATSGSSVCQHHEFPTLEQSFSFRYISGAGDPRTKVHLVLGKSDPNNSNAHHQQSIVIVPADAPGVKVIGQLMAMGFADAPEGHSEVIYDNVRVPLGNLILGWGRGFEVGTTREYIPGPANSQE